MQGPDLPPREARVGVDSLRLLRDSYTMLRIMQCKNILSYSRFTTVAGTKIISSCMGHLTAPQVISSRVESVTQMTVYIISR